MDESETNATATDISCSEVNDGKDTTGLTPQEEGEDVVRVNSPSEVWGESSATEDPATDANEAVSQGDEKQPSGVLSKTSSSKSMTKEERIKQEKEARAREKEIAREKEREKKQKKALEKEEKERKKKEESEGKRKEEERKKKELENEEMRRQKEAKRNSRIEARMASSSPSSRGDASPAPSMTSTPASTNRSFNSISNNRSNVPHSPAVEVVKAAAATTPTSMKGSPLEKGFDSPAPSIGSNASTPEPGSGLKGRGGFRSLVKKAINPTYGRSEAGGLYAEIERMGKPKIDRGPLVAVPIKSATLEQIIYMLTDPLHADSLEACALCFFGSLPTFTTMPAVLTAIVQRYNIPMADFRGPTKEADTNVWMETTLHPVRRRVCEFLKRLLYFVELYKWEGLACGDEARNTLNAFVANLPKDGLQKDKDEISIRLEQMDSFANALGGAAPRVASSKRCEGPDIDILDFDPKTMAEQLTIVEHESFAAIEPMEVLDQNWKKGDKRILARNVLNWLDHSSNVTAWVVASILSCENSSTRLRVLKKFVFTMDFLADIYNFNTLFAIHAAINHQAIVRLKQTMSQLKAEESELANQGLPLTMITNSALIRSARKVLEKINALCDSKNGCAAYKKAINNAMGPKIPYHQALLDDFAAVDSTKSHNSDGTINMTRCARFYGLLDDVIQQQNVAYKVPDLPRYRKIVRDMKCNRSLTEAQLISISREVEPDKKFWS